MKRSLIWTDGNSKGWVCSNCKWAFPIPTLLSEEEAVGAYNRLAAVRFREHKCAAETGVTAAKQETKLRTVSAFEERAGSLIKRGYTPKVAVELVLHETEIEHRNDPKVMKKAHPDGEDFLMRVRRRLI